MKPPSALSLVTSDDRGGRPDGAAAVALPDPIDLSGLPPLLTAPEVIKLTRLGKSHVYQLITEKQILSLRMGGSIRVPKAALLDYMRRCAR